MLGRDAGKIEYWHFKDDSQTIYTRTTELVIGTQVDEVTGAP